MTKHFSRRLAARKKDQGSDEDTQILHSPCSPAVRPEQKYPRTGKRGAPQVFPRKLYQILQNEKDETVRWTKGGHSFIITDMETFTSETLLSYFRHTKYSSFQRQLNLYVFTFFAFIVLSFLLILSLI